ncbi:MAG: hypothetical protein LBR08_09035 [Bacteroidales bacterium]|nr:hypothetical protein [Bacteroidales bacterium]
MPLLTDNEVLTFGDEGILLYKSDETPEEPGMHLWLTEPDNDIRDWSLTTDDILKSRKFSALLKVGMAALAITTPVVTASIILTGLTFRLIPVEPPPNSKLCFDTTSLSSR